MKLLAPIALILISPLWAYAGSKTAGGDRFEFRAHITSIGWAAAVAWAASQNRMAAVLCVILLVFYCFQTRTRTRIWAKPVRYWGAAVLENPANWRARNYFGIELMRSGPEFWDTAEVHFWTAYRADDRLQSPIAALNLTLLFTQQRKLYQAESIATTALARWSPFPVLLSSLAVIYMLREDYGHARVILDEAILLDPSVSQFFQNRADCFMYLGDLGSARMDANAAQALRVVEGNPNR